MPSASETASTGMTEVVGSSPAIECRTPTLYRDHDGDRTGVLRIPDLDHERAVAAIDQCDLPGHAATPCGVQPSVVVGPSVLASSCASTSSPETSNAAGRTRPCRRPWRRQSLQAPRPWQCGRTCQQIHAHARTAAIGRRGHVGVVAAGSRDPGRRSVAGQPAPAVVVCPARCPRLRRNPRRRTSRAASCSCRTDW